MTATAARKFTRTDEEWAAEKARRAELRTAVDSFEIETPAEQDAYDRLTERYSHRNSLLIILQCPTTRGDVMAKSKWAEQGLGKIRKGQHGLLILAPAKDSQRADVEETETDGKTGTVQRKRFVWVRVYDRSQMEAFPAGWTDRSKGRTARTARPAAAPAPAPAPAPAAPAAPSRHTALDDFLS